MYLDKILKIGLSATLGLLIVLLVVLCYFLWVVASHFTSNNVINTQNSLTNLLPQHEILFDNQAESSGKTVLNIDTTTDTHYSQSTDGEIENSIASPIHQLLNQLTTLSEGMAKQGVKFHPMEDIEQAEHLQFIESLYNELMLDPTQLSALITQFETSDPESFMTKIVATVLSKVGGREVETIALSLASDVSRTVKDRRMALNILQNQSAPGPSPEARRRLFNFIANEAEAELAEYGMIAVRGGLSSAADIQLAQKTFTPFLTDTDEHLRRHSAYQISEFARTATDLDPLLPMVSDKDFNVRARVIGSLAESKFTSPKVKETLFEVLRTENEDPLLRKLAFDGIKRYSLEATELAELKSLDDSLFNVFTQ